MKYQLLKNLEGMNHRGKFTFHYFASILRVLQVLVSVSRTSAAPACKEQCSSAHVLSRLSSCLLITDGGGAVKPSDVP